MESSDFPKQERGVRLAKGRTIAHPMLAHSLVDIQRCSLDSSDYINKIHHLNHINLVLRLSSHRVVSLHYFT